MTAAVESGVVEHVRPVLAWRPSWAVGACRQAAEGVRPDVVAGDVSAPCAGMVWPADELLGGPYGCSLGDGHVPPCRP